MSFILKTNLEKKIVCKLRKKQIEKKDLKKEAVSKFLYFALKQDSYIQKKEGDLINVGDILISGYNPYQKVFSPCSGKVKESELKYCPIENKKIKHLVLENDFKYKGSVLIFTPLNYKNSSPQTLLKRIKDGGILGMGGALYPAFKKYEDHRKITHIIINAIECEPFLKKDENLLNEKIYELIRGIKIILKIANASKCSIAIKKTSTNKEIINFLRSYTKSDPKIELKILANHYPIGWEKLLVEKITKKTYENYPLEAGVVVSNIETIVEIGEVVLYGKVKVNRKIEVLGDKLNKNYEYDVLLGTSIDKIIEKIGNKKKEKGVFLTNGAMGSKALNTLQTPIFKNNSQILILDKKKHQRSPCFKCSRCYTHCPSKLYPIEIKEALEEGKKETLKSLNPTKCCECGLCSFICPSKIEILDSIIRAKKFIKIVEEREKDLESTE